MFLAESKGVLREALKRTFDADYPNADFVDLHTTLSFPAEEQDYPGIWVGFEPGGQLETAGIDHREYMTDANTGKDFRVRRWRYTGQATYTIVALSNLERDRLFDEVVKILAFSSENPERATFRQYVETNPLIAMNLNFDQIGVGGFSENPGTPWGTDDVIYEATITIDAVGEFLSDIETGTLVPISEITVAAYHEGEPDPATAPPLSTDPGAWQ